MNVLVAAHFSNVHCFILLLLLLLFLFITFAMCESALLCILCISDVYIFSKGRIFIILHN